MYSPNRSIQSPNDNSLCKCKIVISCDKAHFLPASEDLVICFSNWGYWSFFFIFGIIWITSKRFGSSHGKHKNVAVNFRSSQTMESFNLQFFSYQKSTQNCYLKHDNSTTRANTDYASGPKFCRKNIPSKSPLHFCWGAFDIRKLVPKKRPPSFLSETFCKKIYEY